VRHDFFDPLQLQLLLAPGVAYTWERTNPLREAALLRRIARKRRKCFEFLVIAWF
jgi:hypothetical protein